MNFSKMARLPFSHKLINVLGVALFKTLFNLLAKPSSLSKTDLLSKKFLTVLADKPLPILLFNHAKTSVLVIYLVVIR